MTAEPDPLRHLSEAERSCVRRYVSLLQERLGSGLERVVLFGSAARGDMLQRFAGVFQKVGKDDLELVNMPSRWRQGARNFDLDFNTTTLH